MKSAGNDGPTDQDLFPSFAECGVTPDDLVPEMAERYRAYLEGVKEGSKLGDRAQRKRADVSVAAETDVGANPSEVILEVGAEGGSLTLYGLRTPKGWRFSRRVIDQTMVLLDLDDEPAIDERSAVVGSWTAALTLMDRYPWHRLYPLEVHPEFREKVWEAIVSRSDADGDAQGRRLLRWREICGRELEE